MFRLSVNIKLLDYQSKNNTVTSRLSTQLDLEVALRTYVGGAYLTVLCPIARTVCVHGQYIRKCV